MTVLSQPAHFKKQYDNLEVGEQSELNVDRTFGGLTLSDYKSDFQVIALRHSVLERTVGTSRTLSAASPSVSAC
jgi:hypothetical protein